MPDTNNLSFEEMSEIIALIRRTVANAAGHSDSIDRLRSALAKLDPRPLPPHPRPPRPR
jgi:hypothetical protein